MDKAMRGERTRASMAVIRNPGQREKLPHDVSGGAREHQTMRRSGPVTERTRWGLSYSIQFLSNNWQLRIFCPYSDKNCRFYKEKLKWLKVLVIYY